METDSQGRAGGSSDIMVSLELDAWYCKQVSQFEIRFLMFLPIPGQNRTSFARCLLFTTPRCAV